MRRYYAPDKNQTYQSLIDEAIKANPDATVVYIHPSKASELVTLPEGVRVEADPMLPKSFVNVIGIPL